MSLSARPVDGPEQQDDVEIVPVPREPIVSAQRKDVPRVVGTHI